MPWRLLVRDVLLLLLTLLAWRADAALRGESGLAPRRRRGRSRNAGRRLRIHRPRVGPPARGARCRGRGALSREADLDLPLLLRRRPQRPSPVPGDVARRLRRQRDRDSGAGDESSRGARSRPGWPSHWPARGSSRRSRPSCLPSSGCCAARGCRGASSTATARGRASSGAPRAARDPRAAAERAAQRAPLDAEARAQLENLAGEIEQLLRPEAPEPDLLEDLAARLRVAIERFEESHPTLTAAVNHVADALARMGI